MHREIKFSATTANNFLLKKILGTSSLQSFCCLYLPGTTASICDSQELWWQQRYL